MKKIEGLFKSLIENMDIIQELLFKIEREIDRGYMIKVNEEGSFTEEEMLYYVKLLRNGGFILW